MGRIVKTSMEINLYNSKVCRLCGEKSENGVKLYVSDERDVSHLINRYLPLKISDDGQYPKWICPGCHLQVESTVEFFDLVISGQANLRLLISEQSKSNVDQSKRGNLFSDDHVIHNRLGSLIKEKRKRGRPSKLIVDNLKEQAIQAAKIEQLKQLQTESKDAQDENTEGRRKRKIKLPSRFRGVVQGRELERIYVEKGVIDKSDSLSDIDYSFTREPDVYEFPEGIIGHMEDTDGSHVVDIIFDSSKRGDRLSHSGQKKKFICEICSRTYTQQSRYISHKMSHHNVQYECIQCLEKFPSRKLISEHQEVTQHTGEGIIENLESETNDETYTSNENVIEESESSNLTNMISAKTSTALDNVFDGMDNIEEAAKVLYGLQNIDRIDCFQASVGHSSHSDINSEFLNYSNLITATKAEVRLNSRTANNRTNKENSVHERTNSRISDSLIKKRHDCATCNKTFANESLLLVHSQLIHDSSETKKSEIIDSSKDVPKYSCDRCDRLFRNPSSALYHKNSEHNHFRFVCLKCGKSFKHKQLLRRHQLVHSQERPFSCTTCSASFKTKPNLLNHLPIHHPVKNHVCHICKQSFAHKTSLKLHLLWHSGSKPFSCNVCGKSFSQNGNLQEHIRIHTNVKPFGCAHCTKKFKTSSQRQIHQKRHNINGIKPYSCHICEKSFLQHDVLKTHLRRHNNEKPFACSYCSKKFSEHWALIKHCRTHTKEKPYHCTLCTKSFADCSNLTKHKKTHQTKSILTQNSIADQPSTSEDFISSTIQDNHKVLRIEKSIQNKCDDIQTDNSFDPIVLADISTNEISDSTVWRLADQNNIDKDNQGYFYVTYEDADFGNRTVKVLNQMNPMSCNQLESNIECSNERIIELKTSYIDEDNTGNTSNSQHLCDDSDTITEGKRNVLSNDQRDLVDVNGPGLEIITSDGTKLLFLQTMFEQSNAGLLFDNEKKTN